MDKIIKTDMYMELFSYASDDGTLRLTELIDDKLPVVTNVQDMVLDKTIACYK